MYLPLALIILLRPAYGVQSRAPNVCIRRQGLPLPSPNSEIYRIGIGLGTQVSSHVHFYISKVSLEVSLELQLQLSQLKTWSNRCSSKSLWCYRTCGCRPGTVVSPAGCPLAPGLRSWLLDPFPANDLRPPFFQRLKDTFLHPVQLRRDILYAEFQPSSSEHCTRGGNRD